MYECLNNHLNIEGVLGCYDFEDTTFLIANRKNEMIKHMMQAFTLAISSRSKFQYRDHSYRITEENVDQIDAEMSKDIQLRFKHGSILDYIYTDSDDE